MSDNGVGYYTKETDEGKIALYIGIGSGVLMYEATFDTLEELDSYIEDKDWE